MMPDENYFGTMEEDVIHDAFLMIISDETEYESIEDVLVGETTYSQDTIDHWTESDLIDGSE